MNRPVLLIPLLLVLSAFFGWKTYDAWNAPPAEGRASADNAARAVSPPEPLPPPPNPVELSIAQSAIASRPLFRPDRKPFVESAAAPGRNYTAELAQYTVIGVVALEGEEKAIVVGKAPGKDQRHEVGRGDPLGGFSVREIREDGIELEADGQTFTLPIYAGGPKGGGAAPVRTEVPRPQPSAAAPAPVPAPPAPAATAPSVTPAQPAVQAPQPQRYPYGRYRRYPYYTPGQQAPAPGQ